MRLRRETKRARVIGTSAVVFIGGMLVGVGILTSGPRSAAKNAVGADKAQSQPSAPRDFPDAWTQRQVADANALIERTETALKRFTDPNILPSLGYSWVLHSNEPGGYLHWINLDSFDDDHILNPEYPESLVFRDAEDGPVLEAAMFILPFGYKMSTIPKDIAWLPRWHVHETPVCFNSRDLPTGIAVEGKCDSGSPKMLPPMVHVWRVDTECGRFAGVDEEGRRSCHDEKHAH